MARRSGKKRPPPDAAPAASALANRRSIASTLWLPLLLGLVAFCVYLPSLRSGLVYDARLEIVEEGYVTHLANLPDVLTLKVLSQPVMLSDRPGTILYLMLMTALTGGASWGYHLGSMLLHALNVALLFVLLRRLAREEFAETPGSRMPFALATAAVLFAVHPLAVEAVSEVSYCSALLAALFTLLALLAATWFRADSPRAGMTGAVVVGCVFAAVACKESGVAAVPLLGVYWLLYRRGAPRRAWLSLLGAAAAVAGAFLAARFILAAPGTQATTYPGGSFARMLAIQPGLWVFMMGKIVWPVGLAADYPLEDVPAPSVVISLAILAAVAALQIGLARLSRLGAFGVAVYWLGLATVSNFVPLQRFVADRYYYLPLAGVAMQLLAVLLLLAKSPRGYWTGLGACGVALIPLTVLTLNRQAVFAGDATLWPDTLRVSPHSQSARLGLGFASFEAGRLDDAIAQFQAGVALAPDSPQLHYNLGAALAQAGRSDEAMREFRRAITLKPDYAEAHFNLGNSLFQGGEMADSIDEYRRALAIRPSYAPAANNLGLALEQSGQLDAAISEFLRAVEIAPGFADAHDNLGLAWARKGDLQRAVVEFREAVRLDPDDPGVRNNLARAAALLK